MSDENFLSRWSRRKVEARTSPPPAEEPKPAVAVPAEPAAAVPAKAAEPLPPVESLTIDSDFSPFMQPGVDPLLRRQALKTLLHDPRFNVMDGLDTYIDDYGKPDPIPPAMLRRMTQSALLGLFESEPDATARVDRGTEIATESVNPDGSVPAAMAQSPDPRTAAVAPLTAETRPDDDPDLRLQQDDGAERPGAAPGARH